MKNRILSKNITGRKGLFLLVLIFIQSVSVAQTEELTASAKKKVILQLNFYAKSDTERTAVVSAIERDKNGKPALATGLVINIYFFKKDTSQLFSKITTNEKGAGKVLLTRNLEEDVQGTIHLIAKLENNPEYEDVEVEGNTQKANITLSTTEEDSTKTVIAKLSAFGEDGTLIPVGDIDITFYTKRLFGLLPLGEDATVTTDENGVAELIFPKHIKGDETGNVTIVAQVEHDETYGTVEAQTDARYAEPAVFVPDTSQALWKSDAPLWMAIAFYLALSSIITTVFYLFYQLYKIRKESSI
ncbi:MAG: hypothetical protein WAO52_03425 [Prolixibacteraceae bacterium]